AERTQRRQRYRQRDPGRRDGAAGLPEPVQLHAAAAGDGAHAARRPGFGPGATGFAATPADAFPQELALAYDRALGRNAAPASFDQRWTAWGSGFGGS